MSTVSKIVYKILGDNSDLAKKLDNVGDMAEKAVASVAKIGTAAMGTAAAGIGVLSKKAIECYSEYEQLAGGVETLFKDSADVVMQYADNAYKTAGMSANAYMDTVTSFSASLLQGLDGDTAKAAETANQAIVDMSDNANKTGTDMELIQNAYQGFAKDNYTMLDNLKLGYGGTQAEMARLINDSGVLGDAMTVTAETVNSVSFDKIIEAIHVIQTNMKISGLSAEEAAEAVANGVMTEEEAYEAGTTAKEAATTIQGSISAMSAAWENFMTGVADPSQDFDRLTSNLIESVLTVANNLMPRIMTVLPQMATGLEELAENLLPLIPETLEKMLPDVLAGANNLISALLETISSVAETAIPIVSENAEEIIDTLLTGMLESLPAIAASAVDLCYALAKAIYANADIITQGAVGLITALADGISDNIDEIYPAAMEAILIIADTLVDNIDEILDAAMDIILALANGLINSLPVLLEKTPEIITRLLDNLLKAIPDTIDFAVEICKRTGETLVNFDWTTICANAYHNLQAALYSALNGGKDIWDERAKQEQEKIEKYKNFTVEEIDRTKENLTKRLGELNAAASEANKDGIYEYDLLPEWIRRGIEGSGKTAGDYIEGYKRELTDQISDLETARQYALHEIKETEQELSEAEDTADIEIPEAGSTPDSGENGITEKTEELKEASEEEKKAAQDLEKMLKQSVTDKFRELETEQLEKGYDDSWLLEQERAFVETLDHNSEVYKDYNLDLLKEEQKTNDALLKEQEEAAKKQKDALEKSYESLIKSRDSLADSLNISKDIFSADEETDKRTGAKKKSRGIDTQDFERKLAAKKKLTSKIAELLEANAPDSLISELLKQDPVDALSYANELLRNPSKLSDIKAAFKEDEDVSNILANMVTEKSDEFEKLGAEAGAVFGESFMEAFKADWESAFESVFSDNTISVSASAVNSANASAASESTYVRRDNAPADSGGGAALQRKTTSAGQPDVTVRVLDVNGTWLAKAVKKASDQQKIRGGG